MAVTSSAHRDGVRIVTMDFPPPSCEELVDQIVRKRVERLDHATVIREPSSTGRRPDGPTDRER